MTSVEPLQDWRSTAASLAAEVDCPSLSVKWGTHCGSHCASSGISMENRALVHILTSCITGKGIMNVWIMQNYKSMKMALKVSILAVNILISNHLALYSHSTLFTTYLLIPVFQACIEKSSSRTVLNYLEKSGAHTSPLSHGGLHTCLILCGVKHSL